MLVMLQWFFAPNMTQVSQNLVFIVVFVIVSLKSWFLICYHFIQGLITNLFLKLFKIGQFSSQILKRSY